MGFLYCHYKDEDTTFRFFVTLLDKFMSGLFENDLTKLKLKFYTLDRLI